ncbi:MAG: SpoIIE family protein phosphatase [Verrucomicrobiota bacterium]
MGISHALLFDALLSRSTDRIYFKDRESRFVVVSDSMADNFGTTSVDELIGKTDFDFFSHEHASQAFEDEQEVIRTGKPIYREAEKETWPNGTITWVSTIKAPIQVEGDETIGILGISRDITREKLAHDALERHDRLLKEQNDIMRADLENAQMVQSVLIPGKKRKCSFLEIAVAYEPSHGVSGDVVTFPRPDEEELRFFLGDVCGHGVSAGIYTILVKYLADRLSRQDHDQVDAVLSSMNDSLHDVLLNRFVTAMNGVFHREEGGQVRFTISHGAHPAFFLQQAKGDSRIVKLDPAPGLGLLPSVDFRSHEFILEQGDRVIFFTDGLVEALNENGEEFGIDRLSETAGRSRSELLAHVPRRIIKEIENFAGKTPQIDDQTCVAFQVV